MWNHQRMKKKKTKKKQKKKTGEPFWNGESPAIVLVIQHYYKIKDGPNGI